jgi:hypothetical protein
VSWNIVPPSFSFTFTCALRKSLVSLRRTQHLPDFIVPELKAKNSSRKFVHQEVLLDLSVIISPTGPTPSGPTATSTWSQNANATAYWLDISAIAPGGNDVYQSGTVGNKTSTMVYSLPTINPATTIYVRSTHSSEDSG